MADDIYSTLARVMFDNTSFPWEMINISCFPSLLAFDYVSFYRINFHDTNFLGGIFLIFHVKKPPPPKVLFPKEKIL